jgi:hypothetical protein
VISCPTAPANSDGELRRRHGLSAVPGQSCMTWVRRSLLDGAALGIQVLASQGHETYVAIRIIGSSPRRLVAIVLSLVPGCELDAWMSDYAMPERAVAPRSRSGPTSWTPPLRQSSLISRNPLTWRARQDSNPAPAA